jgi:hypothetical protein
MRRLAAVLLFLSVFSTVVTMSLAVGPLAPLWKRDVSLGPARPDAPAGGDWRRTAVGWERVIDWPVGARTAPRRSPQRLHPLLVALLELFSSLAALLAFHPQVRRGCQRSARRRLVVCYRQVKKAPLVAKSPALP